MRFPSLHAWTIIASVAQPITILILLGLNLIELSIIFEALVYGLVAGTFTTFAIVIIGRYKNRIKNEENSVLLSEYREKYQKDLNELFHLVIDNAENTLTKTYYEAIMVLPFKEKRLFLQHLYTDEKLFHKHYKLYSTYRKFVGSENAIDDDKRILVDEIFELNDFLIKIGNKYKKSKTWFTTEKIANILHLPDDLLHMKIAHYSYPNFYEKIPNRLTLERYGETKEEILFKIGKEVLGGTNSNDHFYKIADKLQPRLTRIAKLSWDIGTAHRTMDKAFSQMYSGLFETALEPMKRGNPIVGACESCIEYFNYNEKQKLKKLLDIFNRNWDGVSEIQWRNKKPLRKLLSQMFTKNDTNSFRDSL